MKPLTGVPRGPFTPLTADARAASLREALAARPGPGPDPGPVHVFAYGSLLWRPCFTPSGTRRATLDGYERAFNVWTVRARGTPERPGLGLGLEASGGRCGGLALEVPDRDRGAALAALWEREMLTDVYAPRWLEVETGDGPLSALVFTVNRDHSQYAGGLAPREQAAIIARARGELGSCRDYLRGTVAALDAQGMADPGLSRLLARVEALARAPGETG